MPPLVQCKESNPDNWCSVGYSQVRSLQGSFGPHKEMPFPKENKVVELTIVDKVVQQVY